MTERIDPLTGVFETLRAISGGGAERKDALTDEWDMIASVGRHGKASLIEQNIHFIVDTVEGFDTHRWETGVKRGGTPWVIVEQYANRRAAVTGHGKWVERLTKEPDMTLNDIDVWGLRSLFSEEE